MRTVTLEGGPFDGEAIQVIGREPLILTGGPVPDGMVARYRQGRERWAKNIYRFAEYDRIVGTIPIPGDAA